MFREKAKELPRIALVGFHRFRRHPPLGAEMQEPTAQLGGRVRGGEVERVAFVRRHHISLSPYPEEPCEAWHLEGRRRLPGHPSRRPLGGLLRMRGRLTPPL